MTDKHTAPYGSWMSPITADLIVSAAIDFQQIEVEGDDIYWIEGRPSEGGRAVIVHHAPDGTQTDLNPAPYNARSRVHEYGGGAFVAHHGAVYFSNFSDGRLYRAQPGQEPTPITPESKLRYADLQVDAARNRLICIIEDHTEADAEAKNYLAAIDLDNGAVTILEEGNDFYGYPRLSPDGTQLAWLTWNHPNMPWDGTELWTAEFDDRGQLHRRQFITGGEQVSITQPRWSPDGTLYFISDRTEWWNLHRWRSGHIEPVIEMEAEFARPQWIFSYNSYDFLSPHTILATYTQNGLWHLAMIDTDKNELRPIETPYNNFDFVHVANESLVCQAASASQPWAVRRYDLLADEWHTLRAGSKIDIDPAYLSTPQPIEFPTANGLTAHGLYYPPTNPDYAAPTGNKPPLIVISHGGPTSAASPTLNLGLQYWTSRGFAVFDVNYGGSTGYGRSYRERLYGTWGIVDVEDCANGAKHLVAQDLADPDMLIIRGGSAGGYTTNAALAFDNTFKAGGSHFGIADLVILAQSTHKFESRYLDQVVGPYEGNEDLYHQRSPIHFARDISCPMIFFQGLDDKVVPPEQSQLMFEAIRANELPTAYIAFEGEGHGFRQAANIKKTLGAELYFYAQVFGIELIEDIEPIHIDNL